MRVKLRGVLRLKYKKENTSTLMLIKRVEQCFIDANVGNPRRGGEVL